MQRRMNEFKYDPHIWPTTNHQSLAISQSTNRQFTKPIIRDLFLHCSLQTDLNQHVIAITSDPGTAQTPSGIPMPLNRVYTNTIT